MTITKFGHCCLLVEIGGVRVVTDPGEYSEGFVDLTGIAWRVLAEGQAEEL